VHEEVQARDPTDSLHCHVQEHSDFLMR